MTIIDEIAAAEDHLRQLRLRAATATCAEAGHRWGHSGGCCAGCSEFCQCSTPVYVCEVCGDSDYGGTERAEVIDECRLTHPERHEAIDEIERLDRQSEKDASLCIACGQAVVPGDRYYQDAGGGEIHAACCGPEREGYANADGDQLGPDDPIPTPMLWSDRPDRSEEETCRARGEANRNRLHGRQSVYEAAAKRARKESGDAENA